VIEGLVAPRPAVTQDEGVQVHSTPGMASELAAENCSDGWCLTRKGGLKLWRRPKSEVCTVRILLS
jgi:hypothetical protein